MSPVRPFRSPVPREQPDIAPTATGNRQAIPDVVSPSQITVKFFLCDGPTQVLSSLSVVLNGGGLCNCEIVTEFNGRWAGATGLPLSLVPKMNQPVGTLNGQRDNIIRAIEGLDRLTVTMNEQKSTIERALNRGPNLQVLVDQRPQQLVDVPGAIVAVDDGHRHPQSYRDDTRRRHYGNRR